MAKGPRIGDRSKLALVEHAEAIIDDLIPNNAISFTKRAAEIDELVGSPLSLDDWLTLCVRYRRAGWKNATHTHYYGQIKEGDGPYFLLSV